MLYLLDMGDISPNQITLVRLVMKGVRVSHDDLWDRLNALPEDKHMERATFDESLEVLVKDEWLWRSVQDGEIIYSPRLKSNEGAPK